MPQILCIDERPPITGKALELIHHIPRQVLAKDAPEEELLAAITDAEVVVTGFRRLSRHAIEAGTKIRGIVATGAGFDQVDVAAATARGIPVANTPGVNAISVAEMAIGLTLAAMRNIPQAYVAVGQGQWRDDSIRWRFQGVELHGKTMGVVGLGQIGLNVARRAQALDMNVLAYTRAPSPERAAASGVQFVTLDELVSRSDVVVLCCALTSQTRGLFNANVLAKMKPTAYLVNVSRAEVVDEAALTDALHFQKIKGAALDVIWKDPPGARPALADMENVIITSHLGGRTSEAVERLRMTAAQEILRLLQGELPVNLVNKELLSQRSPA